MTANPYTPDEVQQAANEQAVRDALALIYRPLSWRQQREVDRVAAGIRGRMAYEDRRRRGVR